MGIVTVEKLENADKDADSLEKFISGSDTENVKTRKAKEYPTLANAVRQVIETGGFEPFGTEVELLASTPILEKKAAKALDTKKVWLWDGTQWNDTGLSEYDLALSHTNKLIQESRKATAWDVSDAAGKEAIAVTQEGHFKTGDTLTVQESTQYSHVLVRDAAGAVALAIDKKGNVVAGSTTTKSTTNTFLHSIVDSQGRIASAVNKDGSQLNLKVTTAKYAKWHKADVMMCSSLGDSLSKGGRSIPARNLTQPYENITFVGGELRNSTNGADYSAFKPYVADTTNPIYADTPALWQANKIVEKRVDQGDLAKNWVFLGTAPQYDGSYIDQLNKGSKGYKEYTDQVSAAYKLCQADNKTFVVSHNLWTHDQATAPFSKDAYKASQIELAENLAKDVIAITGQKFKPKLFCGQVSIHKRPGLRINYNTQAQALFEAGNESDLVVHVCPSYQLERGSDNVHFTSNGSQQLGYYYARVFDHVCIQGKEWMPLQPININWQGRIIDVIFNVPYGELAVDKELVVEAPNLGFDVWDKYNTDLMYDIISSVELTDKNRVRITLKSDAPDSAILSYARGRVGDTDQSDRSKYPRGNIRDTAGIEDTYTNADGQKAYLHNWCVMFNIDRNFSI